MRQTAYIISVNDIKNSQYTKSDGEWDPNYIKVGDLNVSRVNIMGTVVSAESENVSSFTIDDGTGTINARVFDDSIKMPEIGDIIMVIGKPREFNEEKYIVPEIVKKIENEKWLEVRKKYMKKPQQSEKKEEPKEEEVVEQVVSSEDDVIDLIKQLDNGEGADVDAVIEKSSMENCEKRINMLLSEGEIFEVKPGRVKVLE